MLEIPGIRGIFLEYIHSMSKRERRSIQSFRFRNYHERAFMLLYVLVVFNLQVVILIKMLVSVGGYIAYYR